jgi:hypothetical protein
MRVINLFAGPGAGKSTVAAGLFYSLKKQHKSVELVTEYAKDLVYSDQVAFLQSNQEYVFAEQNRRQHVLIGKVDIAITDSPLLLSHIYANQYAKRLPKDRLDSFLAHVNQVFNSYTNINFFLQRPDTFQQAGRVQNLEESKDIDNRIVAVLNNNNIPFEVVQVGDQTVEKILAHL